MIFPAKWDIYSELAWVRGVCTEIYTRPGVDRRGQGDGFDLFLPFHLVGFGVVLVSVNAGKLATLFEKCAIRDIVLRNVMIERFLRNTTNLW